MGVVWRMLLCALFLISATKTASQARNFSFERLPIDQMVGRCSIYSLCDDSRGFLWVGTSVGLCRYDGYALTIFDHTPLFGGGMILADRYGSLWYNPGGGEVHRLDLTSEKVTRYHIGVGHRALKIYEDHRGVIWVGTRGDGVGRFERSTDSFVVYTHKPGDAASLCNDTVFRFCDDDSGNLWVGTRHGLDRFERKTGAFVHCEQLRENTILALRKDSNHVVWAGTDNGLCKFDEMRGSCERFKVGHRRNISVWAIHEDRQRQFWVATDDGVEQFDRTTKHFNRRMVVGNNAAIGAGWPLAFYEDRQGRLWTPGSPGLAIYDPLKGGFEILHSDPLDPHALAEGAFVTSIIEDKAGSLWFAMQSGSVCRLESPMAPFHHITADKTAKIHLTHAFVSAILEDHEGTLWIGSHDGLDRLNPATGALAHYDYSKGLGLDRVYSVIEDHPGFLWVAGSGGLYELNTTTQTFTRFAQSFPSSAGNPSYEIMSLCIDRSGTLWLGGGTGSGLLEQFDRRSRKFTNFFCVDTEYQLIHASPISSIHEDEYGVLWFTQRGLSIFDRVTGLARFRSQVPRISGSLSSGWASTMCEDAGGGIWYGTTAGLERFDRSTGTFTRIGEKDGLASGVILAILEDNSGKTAGGSRPGNLWLLTLMGISRFNPVSGAIRNFGPADGVSIVPSEWSHSAFKNREGVLYFGGTNGFVRFHPDSVTVNRSVPPVVITAFRKFNVDAELDTAIGLKKRIELSYRDNVISFEFAALNYVRPEKNQYAYKLEGFDRDWVYSGTRRDAMYTNLEPGSYLFRVKGSNNDGVWNEVGASVLIVVTPPVWGTWWFRIPAGGVLAGALLLVYRRRVSRLKKEKLMQQQFSHQQIVSQEAERKRLAAELHDGLGQNLLVMSNALQQFVRRIGNPHEELEQVASVLQESIDGVREIASNLHPHLLDRLGFRAASEAMAEAIHHSSGLTVDCMCDDIDRVLPKDQEIHLYRIIQEALTNVVRHAAAKKATVRIVNAPGRIEVEVADDGKGFTQPAGTDPDLSSTREKARHGFGLSSMGERARIIGAMLHIDSAPGSGTRVMVTVPHS